MTMNLIQRLLPGIIDYAGLFPPAKLEMRPAVEEYANRLHSQDVWMLGRFVVPLARLEEFEIAAQGLISTEPGQRDWTLSVLVGGDLSAARQKIDAFNRAHSVPERGVVVIEAVEHKPETIEDVAAAAQALAGFEIYLEFPYDQDPAPWMRAAAAHGARAKIRSGGVTADAFPTSSEMVRFIAAAKHAGVTFKATAGLHHPLRGEYRLIYEADSSSATMHGFLNVFLAAAWLYSGEMHENEAEALLQEREPTAFVFGPETVRWRDKELHLADIETARRNFATSYGSCSFAEPMDDLKKLRLL